MTQPPIEQAPRDVRAEGECESPQTTAGAAANTPSPAPPTDRDLAYFREGFALARHLAFLVLEPDEAAPPGETASQEIVRGVRGIYAAEIARIALPPGFRVPPLAEGGPGGESRPLRGQETDA